MSADKYSHQSLGQVYLTNILLCSPNMKDIQLLIVNSVMIVQYTITPHLQLEDYTSHYKLALHIFLSCVLFQVNVA